MLLTKVRSGSKKGGVRIFSFYKIPLRPFYFFTFLLPQFLNLVIYGSLHILKVEDPK